jgi:hypothetical protein
LSSQIYVNYSSGIFVSWPPIQGPILQNVTNICLQILPVTNICNLHIWQFCNFLPI